MKITTDLHCHTVASDHAYSTVLENAKAAAAMGLEAIAITDHAPAIQDAAHPWHFCCLKELPEKICGVKIIGGAEVNISDTEGTLDLPEWIMKDMKIVIASIHNEVFLNTDFNDNTKAYLSMLENKYVDIIGHSGNPRHSYDIDVVLKRAKELGKMIEINNKSFAARPENRELCTKIAMRAKELGVGIVVNSDAHFCEYVGVFDEAVKMLREIEFPEKLIMNRSYETIKNALAPRKII